MDLDSALASLGFASEVTSQELDSLNKQLASLMKEDVKTQQKRKRTGMLAPMAISHFAMYFERDCERFLNWSATLSPRDDVERRQELLEGVFVNTATLKGQPWEDKVIADLRAEGRKVYIIERSEHSIEETREVIAALQPGEILAQAKFVVPDRFYRRWSGTDFASFQFKNFIPDIIYVSSSTFSTDPSGQEIETRELVIADIKASKNVKLYHKIQVTMYIMLLKEEFALRNEIACNEAQQSGSSAASSKPIVQYRISDEGEVWLKHGTERYVEKFDSTKFQDLLSSFLWPLPEDPLSDSLFMELLTMQRHEAQWQLDDQKCAGCDFRSKCTSEAMQQRDVGILSRISRLDKAFLKHLIRKYGRGNSSSSESSASLSSSGTLVPKVTDIEELDYLVHNPPRDDPVAQLKLAQVKSRVEALSRKELILTDVYSTELAKNPHISVLLNLVRDPLTDDLCIYRITIDFPDSEAKSLGKSLLNNPNIPDGRALEADLIQTLAGLMKHFAPPAQQQQQSQKTAPTVPLKPVQFIVFDEQEMNHLIDILLAWRLDVERNVQLSKMAGMVLLALLPHTSILLSADSTMPDIEGQTFPRLICLKSSLHQLVALPVLQPTWTLQDWVSALKVEVHTSDGPTKDAEILDHYLIGAKWHEFRTAASPLAEFEPFLAKRAAAVRAVYAGIKKMLLAANRLHVTCPDWAIPQTLDYGSEEINRMAFVELYEDLIDFREKYNTRFLPREERLLTGKAAILTLLGNKKKPDGTPMSSVFNMRIDRCDDDSFWEEVESIGTFPLLLSTDDADGERKQHEFNDMPYRAEAQPQALPKAYTFAKLANNNPFGADNSVQVNLGGYRFHKPGTQLLAHLRYLSFNAEKIQAHLQENKDWSILNGKVAPREAAIFGDAWKTADSAPISDEARIFTNLSASKQELFGAVLKHSIQLVWGPPGSGKTHFLAATIELLIRLSRNVGIPCRILCSAFTKNATCGLLSKLVGWSDNILWLGDKDDPVPKSVKCIESASQKAAKQALIEQYLSKDVCIIGGTVWKIQKWLGTDATSPKFDLVVIDEASQLAILPATIASSTVMPETGRIVIVGDHRQISPIRKGKYPAGQLYHSSIFHWLEEKLRGHPAFGMLRENHRMNDELCRLTHPIYSDKHNPVPEIGARRLNFNIAGDVGSIVNHPNSNIMIVLRFDQHSGYLPSPTGPEAILVTRLASAIVNAPEFAPKDLIVCVPHRQQRSALIAAFQPPDAAVRIDTVNRMQGQEAEATICSYGLLTPAMIDRETAFIYSISMLIVASTRAKRKNVIIVPEYLLASSFSVLNDPKLFECLTYLHNLVQHSHVVEMDVETHPLCQL